MLSISRSRLSASAKYLALAVLAFPLLTGCIGGTIRQLRTDKEMLNARIMQLNQDLGAVRESAETEKARADAAESALAALQSSSQGTAQNLAELERKHQAMQYALQTTTDSQSREVARRIEEALANEQQMKEEVTRLSGRIGTLEMDVARLSSEKTALESRLADEQAQTKSDSELIEQTRDVLEKQSQEITKLAAEREENAKALEEKAQEAVLAGQRASTLEQQTTELTAALAEATKERDTLKAELAAATAKLDEAAVEAAKPKARVAAAEALRDALAGSLRSAVASDKARVVADGEAVRIQLFSDNIFKPASTQLSDDGAKLLGEVVSALKGQTYTAIIVEGHTDNVPVGSLPYADNWELASARANEVLRWLAGKSGLEAAKSSSRSYSLHRPIGDNKTPEGRKLNRRVELKIEL